MLKEFKAFIAKGNVLDLAIGLIMATYFGAIVKSLVDDMLMPMIGNLIGGIDFKEMKFVLTEAVVDAEGVETAEQFAMLKKMGCDFIQAQHLHPRVAALAERFFAPRSKRPWTMASLSPSA